MQVVQVHIQFQHIHSWFAQKAQLTPFDMIRHQGFYGIARDAARTKADEAMNGSPIMGAVSIMRSK